MRGVGQHHPLHRAVRDVPLVPQGDVLEAGRQVAPQHPGQAAQPLGQDRVALVGHGRAALLARLERLLDLAQLAAGQVADLGGDQLDGGPHRGAGPQVLGVAVPGHHLGGRHRGEAEGRADVGLDPGVDVGVRPDRARTACPPPPARGPPAAAARRGRPAGPTGRTWPRRWSARRASRGSGRSPGRRCTRGPGPCRAATSPAAPR